MVIIFLVKIVGHNKDILLIIYCIVVLYGGNIQKYFKNKII